jgi:hypothetical protein
MHCLFIALALFGLFAFLRHHRHHGWAGGGCGHRGWRGGHRGWDRGRDRGHGGPEDVLDRLDLSPEQEKVVRTEVRTIFDQVRGLRDERDRTRSDLGRAVRGDFDEVVLGEMFARHDERLEKLRGDVTGALGRIHAVLEPAQRERLADLIERGLHRGFGPYRV